MAKARTRPMNSSSLLKILEVFAVAFLLLIAVDGSTMENAKERVNLAADEGKIKGSETMQDAMETIESWAGWAKEKLAGLGIAMDDDEEEAARDAVKKARDIAVKTKDMVADVASGAADKAKEAKGVMKDKAEEVKETLKDKASHASESISNLSVEEAETAYEGAKHKATEAYDAMSQGAKEAYEDAKERVVSDQATGNHVGVLMNHEAEEL
ncbi:uncharacterized protein A4U43_C02F8560 [Asparagus officinalis]|uniref:Uncharacterized protein n=1 Tax=Asparagus officinalis TaxID=4686 RepID=A0A5P1FHS6_ASPOF|nr:late embryogenesis abundant protein D-29-like [Asparagus officinalis]ONK77614.1 uncharacterized protein A4U43_C02F8560 [Asparagus officinalis]